MGHKAYGDCVYRRMVIQRTEFKGIAAALNEYRKKHGQRRAAEFADAFVVPAT
jgi:hypothetical protein